MMTRGIRVLCTGCQTVMTSTNPSLALAAMVVHWAESASDTEHWAQLTTDGPIYPLTFDGIAVDDAAPLTWSRSDDR